MQALTKNDVRTLLPLVPHADPLSIEQDLNSIRNLLVIFGIDNRERLEKFVKSKEIFDYLANVYERELNRSPDNPLDWTAIAVWGGILFTRGFREEVKTEIEKKIRDSDEWRQKNQKTGVPA